MTSAEHDFEYPGYVSMGGRFQVSTVVDFRTSSSLIDDRKIVIELNTESSGIIQLYFYLFFSVALFTNRSTLRLSLDAFHALISITVWRCDDNL